MVGKIIMKSVYGVFKQRFDIFHEESLDVLWNKNKILNDHIER